jgi:hypothetical protein
MGEAMGSQVLECPFCGGVAALMPESNYYYVACLDEECAVQSIFSLDPDEVLKWWNRRPGRWYAHRNGEDTPPSMAGCYWIDDIEILDGGRIIRRVDEWNPDLYLWHYMNPSAGARFYGPIPEPVQRPKKFFFPTEGDE